ncbi:SRPBCC domain-containing protein [Chitinophaga sp. MD30]|uniref:SRPBCC family protein n=2 Tax=Chitinophaga TaxID=79328 RepID=UPI0012FDB9EE|nr:SRPBCC domain-containing protein [Chitinophaga sp. MD30]
MLKQPYNQGINTQQIPPKKLLMHTSTHEGATGFTLAYTFQAPQEQVFGAFGNAEALNAWWGPAETQNSVICLDFRPGGIFHFRMVSAGGVHYGRFLFTRIEPHYLLEFNNAFADEDANVVPPPFDLPFPLEVHYKLVFSEYNGATTITLTGTPVDADPEATAGFHAIRDSMEQGFGGTFGKLAHYLQQQ